MWGGASLEMCALGAGQGLSGPLAQVGILICCLCVPFFIHNAALVQVGTAKGRRFPYIFPIFYLYEPYVIGDGTGTGGGRHFPYFSLYTAISLLLPCIFHIDALHIPYCCPAYSLLLPCTL